MANSEEKKNNMLAQAIPAPFVSDHDLVIEALSRREYMWRTVDGIANETGLSRETVSSILKSIDDHILCSAIPDENGRSRYTTLEHYRAHAGILRRVLDTLSDQVR